MKKIVFYLFILMFLLPTPTYAWWNNTHGALAEKVCMDFNCSCVSSMTEWANIPDAVFKDMINHHDYNLSDSCPKSSEWVCPTKNDFKASKKMNEYLKSASMKTGCDRWKDIGIASHYFFDTKVFWHTVQKENYFKCHKAFEEKINNRFVSGDVDWTECTCGVCVSYDEFEPWVYEFEEKITFEDAVTDVSLIKSSENNGLIQSILNFIDFIRGLFK
ncbi:MAG: hypothetical protein KAS12_02035, partial [Candidatus Aenigmarchaeota archaeon]|nr:hypothetical protein [Candidatus Aenigmarchaeota archaeon]